MEVGDCYFVPRSDPAFLRLKSTAQSQASNVKRARPGTNFLARTDDVGFRLWRIA